jgi:hypothetical protein
LGDDVNERNLADLLAQIETWSAALESMRVSGDIHGDLWGHAHAHWRRLQDAAVAAYLARPGVAVVGYKGEAIRYNAIDNTLRTSPIVEAASVTTEPKKPLEVEVSAWVERRTQGGNPVEPKRVLYFWHVELADPEKHGYPRIDVGVVKATADEAIVYALALHPRWQVTEVIRGNPASVLDT